MNSLLMMDSGYAQFSPSEEVTVNEGSWMIVVALRGSSVCALLVVVDGSEAIVMRN